MAVLGRANRFQVVELIGVVSEVLNYVVSFDWENKSCKLHNFLTR